MKSIKISVKFVELVCHMKVSETIQRHYDNKGTDVCYIWPSCYILMSFAYIGTLGRGVVALVSFSIHVPALYKQKRNSRCD